MSITRHWASTAFCAGVAALAALGCNAQVRSHEAWADDQAISIKKDARFCSFIYPQNLKDRLPLKGTRQKFYSDAEGQVRQIVLYSDLDAGFSVLSGNVPNAAAFMQEDGRGVSQRYIVFHPQFLAYLQSKMKTPWAAVGVFAHEVGHHLAGHTLLARNQRHFELQADWYSGYVLNKMGASLDETQRVLREFWTPEGPPKADSSAGLTHPPSPERLASITNGWRQADCEIYERNCQGESQLGRFEQLDLPDNPQTIDITPGWICKVHGEQLLVGASKLERSRGANEIKAGGKDQVLSVYWQRHAERRTIVVGQMMAPQVNSCPHLLRVDLGDGFVRAFCGTPENATGNLALRPSDDPAGATAGSAPQVGICVPCQSRDGGNDAFCPKTL